MTHSGNSAFPLAYKNEHNTNDGLTKREYFAVLAMQGLWANSPQSPLHGQPEYDTVQIARMAVQAADDLIAELNKTA